MDELALGLSILGAIANLFAGIGLPAQASLRPIESVEAGDLVWAMDPETGEEDWREVLETFVHPDAVLEFAIEDGTSTEVLTVTGGHPFWERERGWTSAGELLPGDEVFTSRGGWARIGGGTWIAGEQLVYNFEVEGAHTYFVGETGAWVHNSCTSTQRPAAVGPIRGYTSHGVERRERLRPCRNPVRTPRTSTDALGRTATVYVGRDARVVLNPSGYVVSVNPTRGSGTRGR